MSLKGHSGQGVGPLGFRVAGEGPVPETMGPPNNTE